MNIRTTTQQATQTSRPLNKPAPRQEAGPAEDNQDKTDIDWSSTRRTAGIAAAFAAVPAAATLIGEAVGQPVIGAAAVLGGAITAFALRPKTGSLLAGTMMSGLGFHGASSFGLAGAVGATVFGAALGTAVDYQSQRQGISVF